MNRQSFGKETMRRIVTGKKFIYTENSGAGRRQKICRAAYIILVAGCVILSGCTRREQLVLETGSADEVVRNTPDEEQGSGVQAYQSADDLQTRREETAAEAQEMQNRMTQEQSAAEGLSEQEPETICVHVCGAVKNPDVYELPVGSRVYEAVKNAGGFSEEADENYVNQAQVLQDGVKLVIPTVEQTKVMSLADVDGNIGIVGAAEAGQNAEGHNSGGIAGTTSGSGAGAAADEKININTATETELCNIPGIGAARAAAIVAYRQEKGAFTSIEDIMNVSGIKEATYAKIKDSIKVN